ncbi:MAG TPA: glycosyltransferase [Thermoanaerobaculia bacterium]|nr:glycosyltransferase [Thermoanaerobaculia bacterium]
MEIAAVVVNYNTRDLLRSCLESIRGEGLLEVVVVDNASTDGSPEMVRSEFPEVRLIANRHNPGYGGGANQGIAACRAPCVLLLNSDTLLQSGAAPQLAAWLDRHPRAAIAGPRLLNPDGTLQSSCFPYLTPFNVLVLNTWLNRLARLLPRFRPTWRGTPSRTGHWVKGAALAIRREAFAAVGGFDESYFMYAEELDLCHRLHGAGWEIHYTPEATVVHVEGASTEQDRHAMAERLFVSLEQFYRQHYPERLPRLRRVVKAVMLERIARDKWKSWRYPERRERLAGDVEVWRRMLRREGPLSPLGPFGPSRTDWRFLLPLRTFRHLVLLGGSPEMAEQLRGIAERVSETLEEQADAVAVLQGANVSPAEAARCLAPGGWLYWESDERRSLRSPWAVPGRAIARLRACGLNVAGVWAVWPSFERHEAYVPTPALGWFGRTHYPTRTLRERAIGTAMPALSGALMTRFFAITAVAGPAEEVPRPVLLTHGVERVILLSFPPDKVIKVPRDPAFNEKTVREQETLVQIRSLLDAGTARALPEPRGTERYGEVVASVESYAPGRSMVLTGGRESDLHLAAEWLTRFHLQTTLHREPWDGREVAESFAAWIDHMGATPAEEKLFDLALARSQELRGLPFPIVWRHRDFTPWNLLRDWGGRLSVLDWEGAQPGLALCDLLHFVSHWDELAAQAATPEARLRAFSLGAPASCRQVTRYCDRLGIDTRFIPLLRVYTRVEIALRNPGRTFDAEYVSALAERVPEELRRAA